MENLDTLQGKIEKAVNLIKALKEEKAQAQEREAGLNAQLQDWQDKFQSAQLAHETAVQGLEGEIAARTHELETTQTTLLTKIEDLHRLQEALEVSHKESQRLNSDLSQAADREQELQQRIRELEGVLQAKNEMVEQLQAALGDKEHAVQNAAERVQNMMASLDEWVDEAFEKELMGA